MQSHQIISGFSDIKAELRTRTRTNRPMSELRLWFSLTDGLLYAHDYELHRCCIVIAIKNSDNWFVRLDPKTFGYKLVSETISRWPEVKLVKQFQVLYEGYGHYPSN